MKKYIIDSDILIYFLKGKKEVVKKKESQKLWLIGELKKNLKIEEIDKEIETGEIEKFIQQKKKNANENEIVQKPEIEKEITYTVKKGDNLWKISRKFKVSYLFSFGLFLDHCLEVLNKNRVGLHWPGLIFRVSLSG